MIEWKDEQPDLKIFEFSNFDFFEIPISKEFVEEKVQKENWIFFEKKEWDRMWEFGRSSYKEMGGLLLGYVIKYQDQYIKMIDQIIESDNYYHTTTYLVLYPELWQNANRYIIDHEGNIRKHIIGWFHTHPNFTPFFSEVDKKTQEHFFNFPFSVGIVIDPFSNQYSVYEGKDSKLYDKKIVIF